MKANDKESQTQMQKSIRLVTFCCILGLLGGCSWFGVYKRDIPQGNLITQDMVQQIHTGMSKSQVIYVMGTPLLEDPMGKDQWDYVYRVKKADGTTTRKRVTLDFQGDTVQRVRTSGDLDASPNVNNQPPASESAADPESTVLDPIPGTGTQPYPNDD
ncbi:outer membrane protein assembly factor BamE [Larsenimonas salina]|uniref:outer membrane protein assembly factor BamE n=1 Tax=Larsenimonas salina TaxID=1295565 RepID=UPI002073D774|nr:outer membrane protein assembly factor BamE [Larsenimonas salina]MCM5705230.1 outer membrane protein assembly factor BamE [Larsenimonas salina]